MIRSFEILFSIALFHSYYQDGKSRDFQLLPSPDCKQTMSRLGLIFRPSEGGGTVYYERINGDILRKILHPLKFTFFLKVNSEAFFNYTELGNRPQASRNIYYFTNIHRENGTIDFAVDQNHNMVLSEAGKPGEADHYQWYSRGDLYAYLSQVAQQNGADSFPRIIEVNQTDPNQPNSLVFRVEANGGESNQVIHKRCQQFSQTANGRYEFLLKGGGTSLWQRKNWVGGPHVEGNEVAVIEIFKDESTDYDHPVTYTLAFQRSEKTWKYFIIQNKVVGAGVSANGLEITFDPENGYPEVYPMEDTVFEIVDPSATEARWINALQGKNVTIFQSSQKLPMYEFPLPYLNLLKDETEWMKSLPNPSVYSNEADILLNL